MWPDNLLLESGDDLLLEAGGLLLLEMQTERPGGNLVKPRLHLGNAPGRKTQTGSRDLSLRLTITGSGAIVTPITLGLPCFVGSGEVVVERQCPYRRHMTRVGAVAHHRQIQALPARTYTGVASEDIADILLLELLLRENP